MIESGAGGVGTAGSDAGGVGTIGLDAGHVVGYQ